MRCTIYNDIRNHGSQKKVFDGKRLSYTLAIPIIRLDTSVGRNAGSRTGVTIKNIILCFNGRDMFASLPSTTALSPLRNSAYWCSSRSRSNSRRWVWRRYDSGGKGISRVLGCITSENLWSRDHIAGEASVNIDSNTGIGS